MPKSVRVVAWSLAGLATAVLLGSLLWLVWHTPPLYAHTDPQHQDAAATTRKWVIIGGVVLAALGLTLAATSYRHRSIRQRRLADRYAKAIGLLGASENGAGARRRGILALERLAVDSPRYHRKVVETLSAFVGLSTMDPHGSGSFVPPGDDVLTALTVLERLQARDPIAAAATPSPARPRPSTGQGGPGRARFGRWELPAGLCVSATGLGLMLLAVTLDVNGPTLARSSPPTLTPPPPVNPPPVNPAPVAPNPTPARAQVVGTQAAPRPTTPLSGHQPHRVARSAPRRANDSSSSHDRRTPQPDRGVLDGLYRALDPVRHVLTRIRRGVAPVVGGE